MHVDKLFFILQCNIPYPCEIFLNRVERPGSFAIFGRFGAGHRSARERLDLAIVFVLIRIRAGLTLDDLVGDIEFQGIDKAQKGGDLDDEFLVEPVRFLPHPAISSPTPSTAALRSLAFLTSIAGK